MKIDNFLPQNHNTMSASKETVPHKNQISSSQHEELKTEKAPSAGVQLTEEIKYVQSLTQELLSKPVVNSERVEEIKLKLKSNLMDILSTGKSAEDAAKRIAEKMIDLDRLFNAK